jgi:hypothetical protein
VGVGEVDPQPGCLLDPGVLEHLVALVPGHCAPQPGWQHREGANQRVRDRCGGVPARQGHQHGVAGLALHERRERRALAGADDEVSFPVPGLAAGSAVAGRRRIGFIAVH